MPTPETESFKASKPTVPPTFDGVNYDDNKALKAAQDSIIREQWVQSMMARLIREEMGKCYYREGVNHLEKCGHLRGKMSQKSDTARVKAVKSNMSRGTDTICRAIPTAIEAQQGQGVLVRATKLYPQVGVGRFGQE